jgi:hypothetical protein
LHYRYILHLDFNNDSLMVRNGGSYTNVTPTSQPSDTLLVVVHPVPDKPFISWNATNGMVSSTGVGNQWPIVSGNRIDLSRLAAGMYFLKVTGASGRLNSVVIVIKR